MSPDELRELAEALDKITPVMGLEELHHIETLDRAADYLRQCAEQRPIGEIIEAHGLTGVSIPEMPAVGTMLYAAPVAPQAEPSLTRRLHDAGFTRRDNRIECDECGKKFTPQFLPIHECEAQAEPQREPLSDDEISKLAWKQNIWTDDMVEFSFLRFAREIERTHGIGGSDE